MIDVEVIQSVRTITKISKQKKTPDRYNIFLDDIYEFSVSEDILVTFHLRKGLTLSENDINEIMDNDSWHRFYTQAIQFLSYRMRSEQEMRVYFHKKEVTPPIIEGIIAKLKENKYINDSDFANAFVRDRMHQSSKGPVLIVQELTEKGVSISIANEAIKQYSKKKQFEKAFAWAKKQQKRKNRKSYQQQNEQLKVKLAQKGFDSEVVQAVFQEVKQDMNEQEELAAIAFHADKLYKRYAKKYTGIELKMKLKAGLYRRGFQSDLINEYVEKLDDSM